MYTKKTLNMMTYFSLFILMVLFVIFFSVYLFRSEYDMWSKVIYFILIDLLAATTIFDIIMTMTNNSKNIIGYLLYIITIMNIIMAFILFAVSNQQGYVPLVTMPMYETQLGFSLSINLLAIIIFVLGQTIIRQQRTK